MNSNRRAIAVRFNLVEQQDLRTLAAFLKCDEQRALKVAFYQMVSAVKEVQKKLAKEQEDAPSEDNSTADGDDSSLDNPYVAKSRGDDPAPA